MAKQGTAAMPAKPPDAQFDMRVNPETIGASDCDELVNDDTFPELLTNDAYEPDEVLINAMGRGWVLSAAGAPRALSSEEEDDAWDKFAVPWLARYSRAYRIRAHQRRILLIEESVVAKALERGTKPDLKNQSQLDELCVALARANQELTGYILKNPLLDSKPTAIEANQAYLNDAVPREGQ